MRKTLLSFIAVFALASSTFAGPQLPQDEQVRTSTVAPDLHNTAAGWSVVSKNDGDLVAVSYQDKTLTVKGSRERYVNEKEHMTAYLYSKTENSGKSEEFGMLYGTNDVARGAIKVNGKWYVSKELYFDNGTGNPNGKVEAELVYDKKETEEPVQVKPVRVKFVLETVDGHREVVFNLQ